MNIASNLDANLIWVLAHISVCLLILFNEYYKSHVTAAEIIGDRISELLLFKVETKTEPN